MFIEKYIITTADPEKVKLRFDHWEDVFTLDRSEAQSDADFSLYETKEEAETNRLDQLAYNENRTDIEKNRNGVRRQMAKSENCQSAGFHVS